MASAPSHVVYCPIVACSRVNLPLPLKIFVYILYIFMLDTFIIIGRAVAQWLRHCATNRQVAGSIPDYVIVT